MLLGRRPQGGDKEAQAPTTPGSDSDGNPAIVARSPARGLAWLQAPAGRDLLIAIAGTLVAFVSIGGIHLNDRFVTWARPSSKAIPGLDDLPLGIAIASVAIAWYFMRRSRESLGAALRAALTAERARHSLAVANARLHDVIESIPDGLVLFDAEDRVVLWNKRYEEIYRAAPRVIAVGHRFEEILRTALALGKYSPPPGQTVDAWIAERMALHRAAASNSEDQVAGGRWVRSQHRRTAEGGSVGIRIDITEIRRREEELCQARDRAQAANRAKSAFLDTMSHEVRTPLTAVLGFSEMILSEIMGPIGSPPTRSSRATSMPPAGTSCR
jgi:signal transduction histidine kinase